LLTGKGIYDLAPACISIRLTEREKKSEAGMRDDDDLARGLGEVARVALSSRRQPYPRPSMGSSASDGKEEGFE
jgi:hypothetical protein